MIMRNFFVLTIMAFVLFISCAAKNNVSESAAEKVFSVTYNTAAANPADNETLILYYSKMGTTQTVAQKIHSLIPEAELTEIKSDTGIMKAVFWHQPFSRNAAIEPIDAGTDKYDRIILCSPIWLQKIASPARTAINTLPLENKQLHLFITCGGYFGEGGQERLKKRVEKNGIRLMSLSIVKTGGKSDKEIEDQAHEALSAVLPELQPATP